MKTTPLLPPAFILMLSAGYFRLTGLTLLSSLFFWLLVFPFAVFAVVKKIAGGSTYEAGDTILGFYVLMIFMIYDHYASDFFFLMIVSIPYNMLVITLVILSERDSATRNINTTVPRAN